MQKVLERILENGIGGHKIGIKGDQQLASWTPLWRAVVDDLNRVDIWVVKRLVPMRFLGACRYGGQCGDLGVLVYEFLSKDKQLA
jgi:hypothetical protein